ncbi:MAG: ferredoxin--NADP reductase [Deltaproteobacteria bacterium]|nr:ferredoxin--NADP reductase [Deltaproteobacteria bacterium]
MFAIFAVPLRDRFEALGRDLRTVAADLVGQRAAPFSARAPLGRHSRVIPSARDLLSARSVRVTEVVRQTADAVTLELAFERDTPAWHAGQFLTLVVDIGGQAYRRAYSIHTAPADGRIAVTVKRVRDGKVSNHLVDHVKEGDVLRVLGPSGTFGLAPDRAMGAHAVLIGGGSGITPLYSIARTLLGTREDTRITLLYGNRRLEDVIFADALATLASAHPERLTVRHVLEEAPAGWTGGVGRLDAPTCEEELSRLGGLGDLASATFFLCGPEGMMNAARATLLARGVDPSRVHEERFSSPAQRVSPAPTTAQPITLRKGGRSTTLVAAPGQTLLEAGLAAGVEMPFSCAMGGCAACKVKLIDGEVASDEPSCLTDRERAEGWVLTCVSRASGPVTLEIEGES